MTGPEAFEPGDAKLEVAKPSVEDNSPRPFLANAQEDIAQPETERISVWVKVRPLQDRCFHLQGSHFGYLFLIHSHIHRSADHFGGFPSKRGGATRRPAPKGAHGRGFAPASHRNISDDPMWVFFLRAGF